MIVTTAVIADRGLDLLTSVDLKGIVRIRKVNRVRLSRLTEKYLFLDGVRVLEITLNILKYHAMNAR